MNELFADTPSWWPDVLWLIPAVGVVVACCAFVWGRRLTGRPGSPPAAAAAPPPGKDEVDVFLHGSASDRRTAPRRQGNSIDVIVSRGREHPPIHGWVVNRSVKGLALMVDQAIPEGTVLEVRPRTASESTPWTSVEVCRCQPQGKEWEIGCSFVRTPQYNVLLLFG
jgi:hypothetical protein